MLLSIVLGGLVYGDRKINLDVINSVKNAETMAQSQIEAAKSAAQGQLYLAIGIVLAAIILGLAIYFGLKGRNKN